MIKINKFWNYLIVAFFCFALTSGSDVFAASAAKQLARGIDLYEQNKDSEAMDYFIDVMVSGDKDQVAEANKYVELIHNRMGGIQTPVEVDINFKEGEVKSLEDVTDASVRAAQEQAQAAAAQAAAQAEAAKAQAAAQAQAAKDNALAEVNAQQQALTERIEANRMAAQQRADQARQEALAQAADVNEAALEAATVNATAGSLGLSATDQADQEAIDSQTDAVLNAAEENEPAPVQQPAPRQEQVLSSTTTQPAPVTETAPAESVPAEETASSTFADLTSPEALEAREIYTRQKIESMSAAAADKITAAKGVNLYFRDGMPDALDMEADVIFQGNKFRPEGLALLDNIYDLMALTQGAAYVILPPGSYTDDVTLSGIRQAMALNSYFVNRGISQGKLHYNMGLVDQEPPARFANLNGLAIVFDYAAKLPTRLEKNENNQKAPLLSMAIVPQCHAIDRALGEAYAIDFSVLETVNPVDNWVLQVVQHGRDGKYYVVRQLEGFTPVYHQILWNGRKGIIGPELPCGKYTLVLTATDLKGQKQTLRRRVIVKCSEQKVTSSSSTTCNTASCQTAAADELCPKCNYKASRLWVKPGRTMKAVQQAAPAAEAAASETDPYAMPDTLAPASSDIPDTLTYSTGTAAANPAYAPMADSQQPYAAPQSTATGSSAPAELPVNNPYDMPYEQYGN
ncbi:hypothetical protein [Candidatus Avelusimicrobium gallicola]|uniref:FlgD Ig-like domain-containing protein n=1 Tax=Candidatus Avelusimicrobium gallicola TaxID=2562704 RepID=A0A1Y4DCY8_9BACT|nr:hypothetical protein [Elusimicrobium sp. An273]OUO56983.1 hypothetical protein B5F75_03810 [Elusimicrobium sp. An273]